jgi:hypothetical protein
MTTKKVMMETCSLIVSFFLVDVHKNVLLGDNDVIAVMEAVYYDYCQKNEAEVEDLPENAGLYCRYIGDFEFFYLKRFSRISGSEDTVVLQVGISCKNVVVTAWSAMREFLRVMTVEWMTRMAALLKPSLTIIGSTTVYSAVASTLAPDLLLLAAPVTGTGQGQSFEAAQANSLHLIQSFPFNQHLSENIYVVLAEKGHIDETIQNHFFLDNRQMLMVDAYVHKATFQWRQLNDELYQRTEQELKLLQKDMIYLLHLSGKKKKRKRSPRIFSRSQIGSPIL